VGFTGIGVAEQVQPGTKGGPLRWVDLALEYRPKSGSASEQPARPSAGHPSAERTPSTLPVKAVRLHLLWFEGRGRGRVSRAIIRVAEELRSGSLKAILGEFAPEPMVIVTRTVYRLKPRSGPYCS
jgi:hypothetical protein